MADCTFLPTITSSSRSAGPSPNSEVFERLYSTDTAAIRAHRLAAHPPKATARKNKATNSVTATPDRVEALYAAGQQKLRSRKVTEQDEEDSRRRRLEEDKLGDCTFRPRTAWDLAVERREKARDLGEASHVKKKRASLLVS